jgi:hypothetical protein
MPRVVFLERLRVGCLRGIAFPIICLPGCIACFRRNVMRLPLERSLTPCHLWYSFSIYVVDQVLVAVR